MTLTIYQPSVAAAVNQEALCNSIIENLNVHELSPLERYAIANMLKQAAEKAAKILSNDGLNYALRKPTSNDPNECYESASKGKSFTHRGFVYAVTFKPEYNYAQPDERGREWVQVCKEIDDYLKKAANRTAYKKALQKIILESHPLLKPLDPIPTILSFKPKGYNDEDA